MGQQSSRVRRKKVVDRKFPILPSKALRKFAWPKEWFATSKSRNQVYRVVGKLGGLNPNLKVADIACMVYVGALLAALKAHNFDAQSNLLSRRVLHLARQLVDKKITWQKSVGLLFYGVTNFPRNLKGGNKWFYSAWVTWLFGSQMQGVAVGMVSIHTNGTAGAVLPHSEIDGHGSLDQEKAVQLSLDLANNPTPTHAFHGQGIVVAVVDAGSDINHPDLVNKVWRNPQEIPGDNIDNDRNGYVDDVVGWNYIGNTSVVHSLPHPGPADDHGTHVAGTIVAHNPEKGVFGVAYDAKFMHLKVVYKPENDPKLPVVTYDERFALAIMYAVDKGAHVINLSFTGAFNPRLEQALEYAYRRNVVVIVASGNARRDYPEHPASSPYVVAVGNSISQGGALHVTSNRAGNKTEYVSAPGTDILSSVHNRSYGNKTGTSMAAPFVSGVVARMLSANPDLSRSQVGRILATSSAIQKLPTKATSLAIQKEPTNTTSLAIQKEPTNKTSSAIYEEATNAPSSALHDDLLRCLIEMVGLAGFAALCSLAFQKTDRSKSGKHIGV